MSSSKGPGSHSKGVRVPKKMNNQGRPKNRKKYRKWFSRMKKEVEAK